MRAWQSVPYNLLWSYRKELQDPTSEEFGNFLNCFYFYSLTLFFGYVDRGTEIVYCSKILLDRKPEMQPITDFRWIFSLISPIIIYVPLHG